MELLSQPLTHCNRSTFSTPTPFPTATPAIDFPFPTATPAIDFPFPTATPAIDFPIPTPAATPEPTPLPIPTPTPASPYKALLVNKEIYDMKVLESALVTLTIILNEIDPDTGTNKSGILSDQTKAQWTSSNSTVASISATGIISANSVGTATMTVNFAGLSKTFIVNVTAP
jgi:hypothetical protein